MTKRMLIDAAHPEETRVVIVDSNRVEELDFESRNKRQLRGNVYLARVTRVEPSLQAAFIEYGGNRHGFLAFSEIHSDYYKIPEADKIALKEQEEEDQRYADEEDEKRKAASAKRKSRTKKNEDLSDDEELEGEDTSEDDDHDEDEDERDENLDPDEDDTADETDAEIADEQVKVASKRRKHISRRRYKIQEVIKRGQILLVQAVKEERGNKGAAMTTYLSLAGRYCVLMPNTPRGGGISRKIANGADRKRLKTIMNKLEVPQGMGVIVRTAGAKRTKTEIERDYDYLSRLWSEIRDTTMESSAPSLIHEEGNLVKRSIRDLFNKDIEEILVQGDVAYNTAHDFISMLMPSHVEHVKKYDDDIPLYLRYGVEKQIENSLDSTVQLKSGGYLVIHPTEALVSVDVNSGRSTKERNIERTALRTNLEAAEELARQMRLRDLAGLIVIDFIDMDEHKNNRAVERKMKEMLSQDRARIQASRISQFGLMEISRQRRRRSLLDGSTISCPHCSGVGRKRTVESSALAAIRAVEEFAVRGKAKRIRLKTSPDVALYLLNEKRDLLRQVDEVADVFTEVVGDDNFLQPHYELEVIEKREDNRKDPLLKIENDFKKEREAEKRKPKKARTKKVEDTSESEESADKDEDGEEESSKSSRRRSRRGRRGGRGRGRRDDSAKKSDMDANDTPDEGTSNRAAEEDTSTEQPPKEKKTEGEASARGRRRRAPSKSRGRKSKESKAEDTQTEDVSPKELVEVAEEVKPKRVSTTRRKAPTRKSAAAKESESPKKPAAKTSSSKTSEKAETKEEKSSSKSARTRKAPAKTTTAKKATAEKAPAKKATTKKPPAKKAAPKKATAKKSTTKKAPAKKPATRKAPSKTAAEKAPVKTAATTRKKAPAKKTAETAEKPETPAKKTRTRKAPAKKASAKAPTKAKAPRKVKAKTPDPETSETKPTETVAPKRTRKAPAKKTAEKNTTANVEPTEAKPSRTRKAPTKTTAAETTATASLKSGTTNKPVVEEAAAEAPTEKKGKIKRGWWRRRK